MRRSLFTICLWILSLSSDARAYDSWSTFSQDVSRSNLWSVAYIPERTTLVAVGEQGTILTYSYGNLAWNQNTSGTDAWLVGVGVGNSRIVVVGDGGIILTSDNFGETWTSRVSGTTRRLNAAAYGGGRWLVVGEEGTVLTSVDGTVWESRPPLGAGFLRALAYGQGNFVFGGAAGRLFSTTDALTFTPVPIATTEAIESIAISASHTWVVGSGGLRAIATQLGTWAFATAALPAITFRGVAVRNTDEVSTVGNYAGDVWLRMKWGGIFRPPFLFGTAVTQGLNEMVAVGFNGEVVKTPMATIPSLVFDPPGYVPYGEDVTLSIVSNEIPQAYQWLRGNQPIPGATNPTYVIKFGSPASEYPNGIRLTTSTGTSTLSGAAITPKYTPRGRPTVIDPNFRSALPNLPTLVIPQPDGKLLVAGSFSVNPSGGSTYGLARLLADGSLDLTFRAGSGIAATSSVKGIKLLRDGRMYVYGSFTSIGGVSRPGLARLHADGSVDASFVPDAGLRISEIFASDPNTGPVVAQGSEISRLNLDGTRNAAFAPLSGHEMLGLDSQGRILAIDIKPMSRRIVRYLATGALDSSYVAYTFQDTAIVLDTNVHLMRTVVTDNGMFTLSYARTGTFSNVSSFVRYLPDGGKDPSYLVYPYGAEITYPTNFAYASDGGLYTNPRLNNSPADTRYYTPEGHLDRTHYATLPDLSNYQILAVAGDGALIITRDNSGRDGPTLDRLVPKTGQLGRLTNLSVRSFVESAGDPLIVGFVSTGTGTTQALVRASGPALLPFDVVDAMPNPHLELTLNDVTSLSNDNWSPGLAARFNAVGAFSFPALSNDAALESTIGDGSYSAIVRPSPESGPGTTLAELYDSSGSLSTSRRFVNVSARAMVKSDRPLIVGFSLQGLVPRTVLIRGAGPALTPYGVTDALADPRLTLYSTSGLVLWSNDDWSAVEEERTTTGLASGQSGAFGFNPGSKDAATVVKLPAGGYTAVLTGAGTSTGTALIEVYEVP